MYCMHTIFDHAEVSTVMNATKGDFGVVYFSILRDPVDLFVSLWDYVGFSKMYNVTLEEYAFANKKYDISFMA